MAAPTFWGSQFSVNTTTANRQQDVKLRALKNGSFIAVWVDESQWNDKPGAEIRGQIFNADGSKRGAELVINTRSENHQFDPQITVLSDGRFAVVWATFDHDSVSMWANVYREDGIAVGGDIKIRTIPVSSGDPTISVTALSNGGFAVAFKADFTIMLQAFSSTLEKVGGEIAVKHHVGSGEREPDIIALEGRYVVFWEDWAGHDKVRGQIFNNDGSTSAGSTDIVISGASIEAFEPVSSTLTNGTTVVSWIESSLNEYDEVISSSIKAQIFNSDGSKRGEEFLVKFSNSSRLDVLTQPEIAQLADGGFAISYFEKTSAPDFKNLYLAAFGSNGSRLGADLLIEQLKGNFAANLATLEDGRVAVSWSDQIDMIDVGGEEIHAQIIDPRQKAISLNGTTRNDQYVGTQFDDTLDGGAGADTLTGAAGNDFFHVDNTFDQVIELSGQGIDTVIASGSYRLDLSDEVEILKLGLSNSRFAYSLEGSNTANAITGHIGANTLKGHGGNDKLYGGAGKDVLSGGAGQDIFLFDTRPNKNTNVDRITDFKGRDDAFHLDNAVFTKLGSGSAARPKKFSADMFVKGSKAQDREDRIVYDKKTGALYYDQDGTGSKAQVKIATLTNKSTLTHDDFFVI